MKSLSTHSNNFDLLKELVKTRFKLRYNNSLLGFLWVLMKPFLSFLILYFIFTGFKGGSSHDSSYAANLFSGLIIYYLFQEGVFFGMNSLMDMANIILKINFNRSIAIVSSIFMALINFVINFFIIIIICLLTGFIPTFPGVLYFGFIILVILGLVYAITLYLSIIFVKVRDLSNIIELLFQLLFWASAVFYNMNDLEGSTGDLVRLNPLAILIDAARRGFIHNEIAHVEAVGLITFVTIVLLLTGRWFFQRNVRKIAEYF